jgi:D-alanyl-D-alanine carboxypeptidase/D-alanyl-D-alanine-endopeptidase (penicillin-binding protein 4)
MEFSTRLVLLLAFAITTFAREEPRHANYSLAELQEKIASHISEPKFAAAQWGVCIISLKTGQTIFEADSRKLLKPASNAKLYTGAMALERFGPDYRIRTSVLSDSEPDAHGVLHGDLIIYGRGDFSASARFQSGNYSHILDPMVEAIKKTGLKAVDGDLVADDTFFVGPHFGAGWAWDDLEYYYGAEVSALTIQDNVIDLYFKPASELNEPCSIQLKPETDYLRFVNRSKTSPKGSRALINIFRPPGENLVYVSGQLPLDHKTWVDAVSVGNPALWYIHLLKQQLTGISVKGASRSRSWPEDAPLDPHKFHELTSIESAPLSELLPKMLKPSENLYAQLLFLQAGATAQDQRTPGETTEQAGLKELKSFLSKAGIDPNEVLLEEGSGLSRTALVTPHATVELLKFMHGSKYASIFQKSLSEAGVDGTLRNRLKELKGKVEAKTGSLEYVNTLSGYMKSGAGEDLAFSIMLNAYHNTSSVSSRDDLDAIPLLLSRLTETTSP